MTRTTRITLALAVVAAFAASGCSKKTSAEGPNTNPTTSDHPTLISEKVGDKTPVTTSPGSSDTGKHIWQDVHFAYDDASLDADSKTQLAGDGDYLTKNTAVQVTIEGHCDERGSTEYNLGLGDRRANATKQFLVSLGISADRMNTVSYGKEKPFCMEHSETCWQQNRRGHFIMAK